MQPATQWMWQTIYMAEKRFDGIHAAFAASPPPEPARRALTQALRELMLLQSSDWEFLVTTQSARDYAERRFLYHYSDFTRLCDCAVEAAAHGALAPETVEYIAECERRNAVFPELELEWWSSRPEKISEYPPAPAEPQPQSEQQPAPPKKAKRKTKAKNDRVS
jgi:1,4-alpha-glucan branching enzyme